jgi:monoamine oxidase
MKPKICIVGSGISALSAASILHEKDQDFVIFEKDDHVGGHAWTVKAGDVDVDVGFQVCNQGLSDRRFFFFSWFFFHYIVFYFNVINHWILF